MNVIVEGTLFCVVELDATVSVRIKVLEPLVQYLHLSLIGYCREREREREG